ncbi:MAG: tRNA (N6-isopentenyl adenosine(37)-C2)-methylthiotransferase MiaB [Acutalibacteraceae bacterium]|nr:tRNA (N6-isopentenyl adenosine(37)-C2)-methylthiotransferase MiaB [Acutalibacteraceae bacterium]
MDTKGNTKFVPKEEITVQREYAKKVRLLAIEKYKSPKALVRTFGCQQNVADGQKIKGMLSEMGYTFTENEDDADFIIFNTCAVREHAEDRVFGNVGALKHFKRRRPDAIVALCGCMTQQQHIADKIRKSFTHVDLVFGTHVIHKLPQMIYEVLTSEERVFDVDDTDSKIAEGVPTIHDGGVRGWLPVMYGCNNFCTYCIVPYVRGRECSRKPEDIERDLRMMLEKGVKDITLLGQNVNSYNGGISFAQLLRRLNAVEGDFTLRFMTSHPKDCTFELLDTMAECEKVEKHLHLPVQSGNDRVLKAMNRHYDRAKYLSLIKYAKEKMPDIKLTSDIIVGFPSETYEEFLDTVSLIKEVKYHSLYTFIYSPRKGTPAAQMDDPATKEQKGEWFRELLDEQEKIASAISASQKGKTMRVLIEEMTKPGLLNARTLDNQIVEIEGERDLIGKFVDVEIYDVKTWILKGKII